MRQFCIDRILHFCLDCHAVATTSLFIAAEGQLFMSQPNDPTGQTPGDPSASPSNTPPSNYTIPPVDYASLPGPFNWVDFLTFKTMIAIPVIMVLFWVGVFSAVITGLRTMFHGGLAGFCLGFAIILFGPFIVRIQCEFLIVIFRINETLREIQKDLRNRR